ncbi:MAG: ribosome maturation factor RimM [Deltaproteobacteria bacterium]
MIEYLEIGKIINTHGIKGELKVLPLTDDPKRYNKLKFLFVDNKGSFQKYDVEYVKYHKSFVILKLRGVESMEQAELLKNHVLKVHRKDAVKLPEGSYFICDIIGMTVKAISGQELGLLEDVLKTGSNDVYIVRKEGKELLIPALKAVVKSIDLESKQMLVDLPEGIMEDEV